MVGFQKSKWKTKTGVCFVREMVEEIKGERKKLERDRGGALLS